MSDESETVPALIDPPCPFGVTMEEWLSFRDDAIRPLIAEFGNEPQLLYYKRMADREIAKLQKQQHIC